MRQQNQQVQQVQQSEWPEVIYLTSGTWGNETFALTREELRETVRSLRGLGEDWQGISEDDATPIYLFKVRDGDTAVYGRGVHPIYGGGTLYLVRRHHGPDGVWYDWEQM